jgi:Sulfotransferase domain
VPRRGAGDGPPFHRSRVLYLILGIIALVVVLFLAEGVYLSGVLKWEDERTVGLAYYGLPPAGRARFRAALRRHARLLSPMLWLSARGSKLDFRKARIQYKGISAPSGSCSLETFARAEAWVPRPEDVFVVTQMKCGTTWMQHIVYEVLQRGRGTLVESGTAMYAISPWIEGRKSVPIDEAPLIGSERPSRIIKTHLPASLCPFNDQARYIYVVRHPVSCFASCIDFVATNAGGMTPELPAFEEWFTSPDLMWWGTWTDHVKGWWDRSRAGANVLFLSFEEMKQDLPMIAREVAEFLGVAPLGEDELANVVRKCGFAYMQEHQDNFEMHPPHLMQTNAELFVSGRADRHADVPAEARARISTWAGREMAGGGFPVERAYPDVVAPQASAASPEPTA